MEPSRDDRTRPIGVLVKIWPKLSETFILEEVLGLERRGLDLRLYALEPASDSIVHPDVARVRAPVATLTRGVALLAAHMKLLLRHPLRHAGAAWRGLQGRMAWAHFVKAGWLAQRLLDDGVAHLHAHFISAPAAVAEQAAHLAGVPFSISAHAKDIYLSEARELRLRLDAARFTVTCTEANRAVLSALAPQAAVHRLYHGVDHARFHPGRRLLADGAPPMIVSVGRLRPKKGLDLLVRACARLRDAGQAFTCDIVGYGPEQGSLQALIDALGLGDQVRLVGKLSRDEVIERYARAAIYVQPARIAADGDRDGIPNVLLEAMAMGLPVVATRVSGIPELVRAGVNGVLVEPEDPVQLANAIAQLLRQPRACAELGCRARDTVVEVFDNDRNLRLLCELLGRPDAQRPQPELAWSQA